MYSPYRDEVIVPGKAPISNKLYSIEDTKEINFSNFLIIKKILIFIGLFFLSTSFILGLVMADIKYKRVSFAPIMNISDFYKYPFFKTYTPQKINYFIHKITFSTNNNRFTVYGPDLMDDIGLLLKHKVKFAAGFFSLYMDDNWFTTHRQVVKMLQKFETNPNFNWNGLVIAICGGYFTKEQIKYYNLWLDKGVRFYNHTRDHFSLFNKESYKFTRVENPSIDFILEDFSNGFKNLEKIFGKKFFIKKSDDFYMPYLRTLKGSFPVNLVIPYGDISAWKKAYIFNHGIPYKGKILKVDRIYKAWGTREAEQSKYALGEDRVEYSKDMIIEKDKILYLKLSSGLFVKIR